MKKNKDAYLTAITVTLRPKGGNKGGWQGQVAYAIEGKDYERTMNRVLTDEEVGKVGVDVFVDLTGLVPVEGDAKVIYLQEAEQSEVS